MGIRIWRRIRMEKVNSDVAVHLFNNRKCIILTKKHQKKTNFSGFLLTMIISKCIVYVIIIKGGLLKMMPSGRLRQQTLNNR